jgi:hypothetical protein
MTSPKGWNKLAKTVFMSYVFALCFLTLFSALYIEFHYSAVVRRNPQPETGRIYPMWFKSGGMSVAVKNRSRLAADWSLPF